MTKKVLKKFSALIMMTVMVLTMFGAATGVNAAVKSEITKISFDKPDLRSNIVTATNVQSPNSTYITKLVAKKKAFYIEWKIQKNNCSGYFLEIATNKKFTQNEEVYQVKGYNNHGGTVNDLKPDTRYYVRVCAYRYYKGEYYFSYWSGVKSVVTKGPSVKKPKKPSYLEVIKLDEGIGLFWSAESKYTTGCQIQLATDKNFTKDVYNDFFTGNGGNVGYYADLKKNRRYYVHIRAYRKYNGKNYYSDWTKTQSVYVSHIKKPKGTTLSKATSKYNTVTVKWKKQTKITDGYQIQVATDSSFTKNKKTKTVKGKSKTAVTVKGLKTNKKYYVRVRTYNEDYYGYKVYSSWSKAKTVKTKNSKLTEPTPTSIIKVDDNYSGAFFDIYFKKVKNCTGYQLQYSLYSDFRTDSSTVTVSCAHNDYWTYDSDGWDWYLLSEPYVCNGFSNDPIAELEYYKTYYFRMRTFSDVNGKRYYSKWSAVKSGTT